jgi:hypothetical protein
LIHILFTPLENKKARDCRYPGLFCFYLPSFLKAANGNFAAPVENLSAADSFRIQTVR